MSPQAQRVAIARAMGLVLGSDLGYPEDQAGEFYKPDPYGTYHDLATWSKKHIWMQGFDPLDDLNDMHEAEKVLTEGQRKDYAHRLHPTPRRPYDFLSDDFDMLHATAAQRCEAFLRTVSRWVEDAP